MYPKINQNIVIDIKSLDRSCRSIIAEVGEKEILIQSPMDGNIIGLLYDGIQLDVIFMSGDHQYKFKTKIIGRIKDNISLIRITKPLEKEIIKIQRRDNFRVNANLRLLLNEHDLKTINISAGGVLFSCRCDLPLKEGEMVSGKLFVPNIHIKDLNPISIQGSIKRINLIENQDRKNVAIEFTGIEQREQMKIIQYCFEKQRQNRLIEKKSR